MAGQSPLRAKPLRNPGDSVDEEIRYCIDDRFMGVVFSRLAMVLVTSAVGGEIRSMNLQVRKDPCFTG